MKISEKIKKLRQEKGWSQAQLAKKLNMQPQNISRYERSVFAPSVDALAKFAEVFGVTIDYLMDESGNQKKYIFRDMQLFKYFEEVDKLGEEDRNLIKGVIESVLAKNKFKS